MSHVVIKKSLAKALMDASMEDYEQPQKLGLGGLVKSVAKVGGAKAGLVGGIPGMIVGSKLGDKVGGMLGGLIDGGGGSGGGGGNPFADEQTRMLAQQQQDIYGQQQNLAQTLLQQSQGIGPNPALAALQNATGQNVQQQSAIMAGQRGASANPALLARQAAMQGAGIQQQSVGQAALMQAQQQIQAQQLLQQQQGQMAGQSLQGQSIYTGQQNMASQIAAQQAMAKQARNSQMLGSLLQTGGMVAGMAMGGPPGAAVGATAGGALTGESYGLTTAFSQGGEVPGAPQVPGDSETNDTQLTLLSPGEIVIPRTIAEHPNAPELAKSFVQHLMTQQKGYGGVIQARQGVSKMNRGGVTLPSAEDMYTQADVTGEQMGSTMPSPDFSSITEPISKFGSDQAQGFRSLALMPSFEGTNPESTGVVQPAPAQAPVEAPVGSGVMLDEPEQDQVIDQAPQQPASMPPTQMSQGFDLNKNMSDYAAGARGEAKATGAMQNEMATSMGKHQELEAKRQAIFNDEVMNAKATLQKLSSEISSGTVDPNRYWSNKSTGSKISTIAGVLLSGIGAGLQGTTKNMAWEALDKNIENDIQQQKVELGKKQTMFSDNLKMLGNVTDAENATRMQSYAILQGDLARIAAKSQNDIVKSQAVQKIAYYNEKMAPLVAAQAAAQSQKFVNQQILNGGGIDPQLAMSLDEKTRARLVPLPSGKMFPVNDPKDAEKLKLYNHYNKQLNSQLDQLSKVVKRYGTEELTGTAQADLDRLTTGIANDTAKMFDPTSANRESEIKTAKGMLFDPGSMKALFTSGKTAQGIIDNYKTWVQQRMHDDYSASGIPDNLLGTAPKDEQYKTVDGVKYKRGPNGEKIRVK